MLIAHLGESHITTGALSAEPVGVMYTVAVGRSAVQAGAS